MRDALGSLRGRRASNVGNSGKGDGEAERGRERLAELGDEVDEGGVEGEELRASNRVGHLRLLAKSDINLGEAGLTEDTLIGDSLVLHADPNKEREKWSFFPSVGEGDGVDRGPQDAAIVEELIEPGACDRVAVDRLR